MSLDKIKQGFQRFFAAPQAKLKPVGKPLIQTPLSNVKPIQWGNVANRLSNTQVPISRFLPQTQSLSVLPQPKVTPRQIGNFIAPIAQAIPRRMVQLSGGQSPLGFNLFNNQPAYTPKGRINQALLGKDPIQNIPTDIRGIFKYTSQSHTIPLINLKTPALPKPLAAVTAPLLFGIGATADVIPFGPGKGKNLTQIAVKSKNLAEFTKFVSKNKNLLKEAQAIIKDTKNPLNSIEDIFNKAKGIAPKAKKVANAGLPKELEPAVKEARKYKTYEAFYKNVLARDPRKAGFLNEQGFGNFREFYDKATARVPQAGLYDTGNLAKEAQRYKTPKEFAIAQLRPGDAGYKITPEAMYKNIQDIAKRQSGGDLAKAQKIEDDMLQGYFKARYQGATGGFFAKQAETYKPITSVDSQDINRAIGRFDLPKSGEIKLYRGFSSVGDKRLRPGDFLTTVKSNALKYTRGKGEVKEFTIPVKDLSVDTSGTYYRELVYSPKGELTQPIKDVPYYSDFFNQSRLSQQPGVAKGKERGFITTVKETLPKEKQGSIEGFYSRYGDEPAIANATKIINEVGVDNAKKLALEGEHNKTNVVVGELLAQKALREGRSAEFKEIVEAMAAKGTTGGQASQAFSIWSRLTPEGMVKYGLETINEAKSQTGKITKLLGREAKELTDSEITTIKDLMLKANKATDPAQQEKFAKLALEIINDKVPLGVSQAFDTFRLNNILSNPRSHLRNIWGNALNAYVTHPTTLALEGRPAEAAKYEIGALTAIPDAITDAVKAFKGDLTDIGKLDIKSLRGRKVPLVFSGALRALEAEDKFFTRLIQNGELARGKTPEQAAKFAEELLYRVGIGDKQSQGYFLNFLDASIGGLLKFASRTPGINWFVPFARTPFNIAKMSLEYSPMGFGTMIGSKTPRKEFAKATLGSLLTLFGAQMAMEGNATFAPPTDPDAKDLFYKSDKRPFSIRVGDKWVPVAYLGPLGLAVMLPAMFKWYNDDAPTALTSSESEKAFQTLSAITYFWSQQTPLSGIGTFVDLARGDPDLNITKNLGFISSQAVPYTGLLNYVAQVMDPIYRRPKGFTEQFLAGIPGFSKNIKDFYLGAEGEPSKRPQSAYIGPYTLGQPDDRFEAPLESRNRRLQENKFLNVADDEYEMLDKRAEALFEAGKQDEALQIIQENKEVFQKGEMIKEARKRVKKLQDFRDEATKDESLTEEEKRKFIEYLNQQTQEHLDFIGTL